MENHQIDVVPSVLSKEELEGIKEYFYDKRKYETDDEYGREGWSYEPLKYLGLYKNGEVDHYENIDERALPLLKVLEQCEEYFLSKYKMNWKFGYKRGFLNCMESGSMLGSHSDDDDIYGGKVAEEIHYSALLFLTGADEYEGGEVYFWDKESDRDLANLKPNVGDLVLFKGSTMHGVSEIFSGERMNYVIFYRDYNPTNNVVMNSEEFMEAKKQAFADQYVSLFNDENPRNQ